ncbi:MAG: caspase family protein [Haliscomenobacter sp.]|nr:caspase family protein [Haliscomenobacter sp.]
MAELQKFDKPPFVWHIDLGAEQHVLTPGSLQFLVNRLQSRQLIDARELDVERTITNLALQPGVLRLHFRQLTQAPSYLLLIDQRATNDHRARIFNMLHGYLRFHDVEVRRFFFDGDPKLCFSEDFPYGITLRELYQQHRTARLLILSYGYELFSPSTGDWSPWTRAFLQWQDRAMLSPLPTQSWGPWEEKLAERFAMLPATPMGLSTAIEAFSREDASRWESYFKETPDAIREPVYFQGTLMDTLERYFPDSLMRKWIAACAFYPALHWELTLHLGALLQKHYGRAGLISMENLLELTRIPWFIEGRIPEQARDELIYWLESSGEEPVIRTLLLESLNRAPAPPDDSAAYADYRMQIVFNQWMLEKDEALKAQLEKEFSKYLESGKMRDFVTFKRLERSVLLSDFLVPEAWKKFIDIETYVDDEIDSFMIAKKQDSISSYREFLLRYPKGFYASIARERIETLQNETEDAVWLETLRKNNYSAYKSYLDRYPEGRYKMEANSFLSLTGRNFLFAIAIDRYRYCSSLSNCVRDAEKLVQILTTKYRFEPDQAYFLYDENATRANILSRLREFKQKVQPNDNLVIYFSGHGEVRNNVGYFIPVEAHPDRDDEFVSAYDLKSRLDEINSFHTFVIVNADFSGSLFLSYRGLLSAGETKRSRWGLSACSSRESIFDGPPGEGGPFASALIKILDQSEVSLSAEALARAVIEEVQSITKMGQTPTFRPLNVKGDDGGMFVFHLQLDESSDWVTAIKKRIKDEFVNGLDDTFNMIFKYVREESTIYSDFRVLQANNKRAAKDYSVGVITYEQYEAKNSEIARSILHQLDGLKEEDINEKEKNFIKHSSIG